MIYLFYCNTCLFKVSDIEVISNGGGDTAFRVAISKGGGDTVLGEVINSGGEDTALGERKRIISNT